MTPEDEMQTANLPDTPSGASKTRHEFEKGLQPFITNSLLQRISGQLDELVRETRSLRDDLISGRRGQA